MKIRNILLATTVALGMAFTPQKEVQAAPLAGVIGAALGGLGTFGTAILGTALSIAGNWLMQKIFAEEPKPQGVKQRMESGGDNPISFIVGKYATAGKLVYVNSYGEDAKGLVMVINLSEIPITSLSSKIVINGRVCDIDFGNVDDDGFDKVTQYQEDGRNYCSVRFFNDPNSAPNFLTSTFGSDPIKPWTNNMIGQGCSYVVVYCRFSTDGIWAGIPQFKFVCQGIPLYDPRKDSSVGGSGSHRWANKNTHEFSENVSVITYNVIRGITRDGVRLYGGNAREEQLPLDIWTAAMNVCDENISLAGGGTIKRFKAGAEISVDIAPMDTLRELDNSCNGYTFEFGGIWKTFVGGPGASVVSITDDNILVSSEQIDDLFKPLQETYNVAQASYPEPNACWEQKDAPTRYFDDYIEEDGEELSMNMEFPYVWERNQVQRLVRAAIKDSRNQRVHTLVLPPPYATLEAFDVFTWTSARNGYIDKKFIILQKEDMPNASQSLVVREINPNDYDWDTIMELEDSVGSLDVDRPVYNKDFTVTADIIDRPSGKKDRPAFLATWDWADEELDIRSIQWRARYTGTTEIIAHGNWQDYQTGTRKFTHPALHFGHAYQIQLRVIPRSQRKSNWTAWKNVTFTNVAVPTGLTLGYVFEEGADGKLDFWVRANWDDSTFENNGYGLRITVDGDSRTKRCDDSRYKFPVRAPCTVSVEVRTRAVDGGTPSAYCTAGVIALTKKATGPGVATGVTVDRKPNVNIVEWDMCTDDDYKISRIYRSTSNVFATATIIGRIAGDRFKDHKVTKGTRYYYWVIHVNRSDNPSALESTSNYADTTGVVLTDTDAAILAAPSGISLIQADRDVDRDGSVDIALMSTFSGAVANAAGYEVEFSSGGTILATTRADGGRAWIGASTIKSYYARWRTVNWTGQAGAWSGYAGPVTPAPKTGAPAAPASLVAIGNEGCFGCSWNTPSEYDYSYSEIAIRYSPGTPIASDVILTTSSQTSLVYWPWSGSPVHIYARHFNTSGLPSSWSYVGSGRQTLALSRVDGSGFGTTGGNITVPSSAGTCILIASWRCTSTTAAMTINIGDVSIPDVQFREGDLMTYAVVDYSGGIKTLSKSGSGTWNNVRLAYVAMHDE